ncbi:MAG TPA: hypothetical protein VNA12_00245 [Mycobacteriales bacterium]|nr:hypothetical protein [Mycobacteriales bacterium]
MSATPARHSWAPYVAALAGTILVLKVALVIGSSNEALDGPMGPVSHLGGVGLGVVAVVGFGLRQAGGRGRRIALSVAFALLFVAWIMGLGDMFEPAIRVFSDAVHVLDEVPIGIAGAALLVLAYVGWSRDQDRVEPSAVRARTA